MHWHINGRFFLLAFSFPTGSAIRTSYLTNKQYKKMFACLQICEGIQDIQRVSHVNPANIIDKYFKRDIPVIVEDGLRDWGHLADKSVQDIAEVLYVWQRFPSFPPCIRT